jgi:hypothetical protein
VPLRVPPLAFGAVSRPPCWVRRPAHARDQAREDQAKRNRSRLRPQLRGRARGHCAVYRSGNRARRQGRKRPRLMVVRRTSPQMGRRARAPQRVTDTQIHTPATRAPRTRTSRALVRTAAHTLEANDHHCRNLQSEQQRVACLGHSYPAFRRALWGRPRVRNQRLVMGKAHRVPDVSA